MDSELRKEEICCYIRQVNTPNGHSLRSTDDMCEAFWQHFQNHFTKEPGFCVQEFHSYLVDFRRLKRLACEESDHKERSPRGTEKGRQWQVSWTWFVLKTVAHVCTDFDSRVQQMVPANGCLLYGRQTNMLVSDRKQPIPTRVVRFIPPTGTLITGSAFFTIFEGVKLALTRFPSRFLGT